MQTPLTEEEKKFLEKLEKIQKDMKVHTIAQEQEAQKEVIKPVKKVFKEKGLF